MPRRLAAARAFAISRDAMGTNCATALPPIPGMTFSSAILAVPSIPQRTGAIRSPVTFEDFGMKAPSDQRSWLTAPLQFSGCLQRRRDLDLEIRAMALLELLP